MLDNRARLPEKRGFMERLGEPGQAASKRPHPKAFEASRPFSQEGLMIEVCFKSGRCRFFDSAACLDAAYEKGDTILVLYATTVVRIEGRNLGELASLIKERRVDYVQEQHDEFAPEDEAYIEAIALHRPDDWNNLMEELDREGRIMPESERKEGNA